MHSCDKCGGQHIEYGDMLNMICAALQVYSIDMQDRQGMEMSFALEATDKILEKLEKLEGKIKRIERMMERSM